MIVNVIVLTDGNLESFPKIRDLIKRRVIDHDHLADSRENKFGKEFPLIQLNIEELPKYIRDNKNKYNNWLDLN